MRKNFTGVNICVYVNFVNTVGSLEFVVAKFSSFSLVALPYEFTSSTETNFDKVKFSY